MVQNTLSLPDSATRKRPASSSPGNAPTSGGAKKRKRGGNKKKRAAAAAAAPVPTAATAGGGDATAAPPARASAVDCFDAAPTAPAPAPEPRAGPREVFVGNIKATTTKDQIKGFFAAAVGEVTKVRVLANKATGVGCYCFLTFASAETATRAVATMNKAIFEGRKLRVGWAAPTAAPTAAPAPPRTAGPIEVASAAPLPPRSSAVFMGGAAPSAPEPRAAGRDVFVGNIKLTASSSEIKAFFAAVGEVTNVKMPMEGTDGRMPFCFVTFASTEAATRAVATMHGAEFEGTKLRVRWGLRGPPPQSAPAAQPARPENVTSPSVMSALPTGRGRGGFAGDVLARDCADDRSAAAAGGHREPSWPALSHGFGPTALSEPLRHRLGPHALRALAELKTARANAIVQRLVEAGDRVRNPSAYVCRAVDRECLLSMKPHQAPTEHEAPPGHAARSTPIGGRDPLAPPPRRRRSRSRERRGKGATSRSRSRSRKRRGKGATSRSRSRSRKRRGKGATSRSRSRSRERRGKGATSARPKPVTPPSCLESENASLRSENASLRRQLDAIKQEAADERERADCQGTNAMYLTAQKSELQQLVSDAAAALIKEGKVPTKEVPDDKTPFYYMFDSHRDDNMQTLPWNPYAGRAMTPAEGIFWILNNQSARRR